MKELIHLIYASGTPRIMTDAELRALLDVARAKNAENDVTGMLLYTEGSFFQVLEGPDTAVQETFNRIARDPRHQRATCIIREPIAKRAFSEWTMGYTVLAGEQVSSIVQLNDFFGRNSCLDGLDSGRARKLLAAFGAGRWRSRLNTAASTRALASV